MVGPARTSASARSIPAYSASPSRNRRHIPRLALCGQVRITGNARLRAAKAVRHRLVAVLADDATAPIYPIRRTKTFPHAVARMGQHIHRHQAMLLLYAGFNVPSQIPLYCRVCGL